MCCHIKCLKIIILFKKLSKKKFNLFFRCGCGRIKALHSSLSLSLVDITKEKVNLTEKWLISRHTVVLPTDAYGTLEFQGLINTYY